MKIANLDPTYSPGLGGATSVTSSGAASAAVADHVADSSGAHTAPAIGVVDAAGWFGATTDPGDLPMLWPELYGAVDIETALAQLAALTTADSAILGDLCLLWPEDDGDVAGGGGGGFTDPTTTKGDLIVRGVTTTRLPVGPNGWMLTADSTQALGVRWGSGWGNLDGGTATSTYGGVSPIDAGGAS